MIGKIAKGALAASVIVMLTLAALELSIRLIGYTDSNGQFVVLDHKLPPYVLPIDILESQIQHYFDHKEIVTLIPDAATGWTYRPNSQRHGGIFTINGAGLRALREYSKTPEADTLRIALFGDSFVVGDEVADDEVWGSILEQLLNRAGLRAEVLNFGVEAYGMDQALIRWRTKGNSYAPDIVIFVVQSENLNRNVNVFRWLYKPGPIVYSKPRFILRDGNLELVNSPALPPEELLDVFETFNSHPLAEHEAYYSGRELSPPLLNASKLAGLAYMAFNQQRAAATPTELYGPASERGQLGKAIVDAFAADVVSSGATFIVLHLPRKYSLRDFHNGQDSPMRFLLDHLQETYHFINAEDFLGVEYTDDSYYQPRNHYGPEINARVAEAVSMELITCIQEETCQLSRFEEISDIRY